MRCFHQLRKAAACSAAETALQAAAALRARRSFLMETMFPPTWQRYFAQPAASVPTALRRPIPPIQPPIRRLYGGYTVGSPVFPKAGGAAPPVPPKPPVDRRPLPPEPPRRPLELAWLTWQLSAAMRARVIFNLRQTLEWRAQYCQPLAEPETPHDYTRFGLLGEQLWPRGVDNVYTALDAELREIIRTVEGAQPHLERNWRLAMHSARLGQLCAELEQRGLDALERLRSGLVRLWD
jgi:hypothetical protein